MATHPLKARRNIPHVLVVDDDPASLELLTVFLITQGYRVSAAADGNRAIELGGSGEFELVILDVHMPLYDGVEVLHMLRMRHVLHPLKIIALTGDTSTEVHQALLEGGVDAVQTKPVDLRGLKSEVDRLLSREAEPGPKAS